MRPASSGGRSRRCPASSSAAYQPARAGPGGSSGTTSWVRSSGPWIARAASSSRPPRAAGRPAQIRVSTACATSAIAAVSVPRTVPYRWARTRSGSAVSSDVTSAVSAANRSSRCSSSPITAGRSAVMQSAMAAVQSARLSARSTSRPAAAAGDRGPPDRRLHQPHRQFRPPGESPALLEGAGAGDLGRGGPVDAQDPQPPPQVRAAQVVLTAQIQGDLLGRRRRTSAATTSRSPAGPPPAEPSARVSGTRPSSSPTTASRRTNPTAVSLPSHSTARVASVTSVRPGSGRPRSWARVRASRTASMTWAVEVGRSCPRSTPAERVIHRSRPCSVSVNRCRYQPGESTPAP